jgi:hypothetical protein
MLGEWAVSTGVHDSVRMSSEKRYLGTSKLVGPKCQHSVLCFSETGVVLQALGYVTNAGLHRFNTNFVNVLEGYIGEIGEVLDEKGIGRAVLFDQSCDLKRGASLESMHHGESVLNGKSVVKYGVVSIRVRSHRMLS